MTIGIYQIVQISTGKRYVGQSIDVEGRWYDHQFDLKRNTHHCTHLQRAWNKYGAEDFKHEIIVECEAVAATLNSIEQKHMDETDPLKLFNTQPIAGTPLGMKHSEETRKKLSEAAKKRNADPAYKKMLSDRAKKQHADKKLGVHTFTEESKRLQVEGIRKSFEDPERKAKNSAMLKSHIASVTPEEMARRASMRKSYGGACSPEMLADPEFRNKILEASKSAIKSKQVENTTNTVF